MERSCSDDPDRPCHGSRGLWRAREEGGPGARSRARARRAHGRGRQDRGSGEVAVPASVQARQRASLAARIPASVTELPYQVGQSVAAGAVVVVLTTPPCVRPSRRRRRA